MLQGFNNSFSKKGGKTINQCLKKQPPTARKWPSLALFEDKFIFISGGQILNHYHAYASVDVYDIAANRWKKATDMNIARYQHSSCCLGYFVYVCCGYNSRNGQTVLNSNYLIERLDIRSFLPNFAQKPAAWDLICCASSESLTKSRMNPMMAPIGPSEIFIMGGTKTTAIE